MKKQLLNLSFVAAALALYVTAIAAPQEPVRTMDVHEANAAIVLDGADDDLYGPIQSTARGYDSHEANWDGESDFKADFQVCWDLNNLYVLAQFQDDVAHNYEWTYSNEWTFDNFELFLQLDTNTVTTSYSPTTAQLRVNRGLDSVQSPGRAARTDWGYYMEADAPGGWIAEVAVPWTAVLATGATIEDFEDYVNTVIGFDFAGADSDNTDGDETVGNRDYQTFWDLDGTEEDELIGTGFEDQAWQNTATFGYIKLVGPVATEVATANNVMAYPNPATTNITFDVQGEVAIEIYNIAGVLVMTANEATVNVSNLESGVYVARVNNQAVKFRVE